MELERSAPKMKVVLRDGVAVAIAVMLASCTEISSPSPTFLAASPDASHLRQSVAAVKYSFTTLNDPNAYSSFNRLLGINNVHRIVGNYGSGSSSDPSGGYAAVSPYGSKNYRRLAYPKALDTVAAGLNNAMMIVGFYTSPSGKVVGFSYVQGLWGSYNDPDARGNRASTQLYGINDAAIAVGCYRTGARRGCFELDVATGIFVPLHLPGRDGIVTSINGTGDIVGYTTESGAAVGVLRKNGAYTTYSYPGAASTEFLGITIHDYIVGSYVDRHGATHGFLLTQPLRPKLTTWQTIDDPKAAGTTVATSVNLHQEVVGYYIDASGNTNGFLATPATSR